MKFILNQIQHTAEMPTAVGGNKIEVVVMVMSALFTAIVLFLIFLERRIAKLEKEVK